MCDGQQLESNPSKTIEYAYDPVGNRTAMTGPDDIANAYTYTLINQVASITDVYNNATNYYYDDGGRLTLKTNGNGTKAVFSYNEANRLTLLTNKKSNDSVISSFTYEYDKAGYRTKRATLDETLKYTYDNIYQITEVYRLSPGPALLETFAYDSAGNRTTDINHSDYSFNTTNQLISFADVALEYDGNGNLTRKTMNGADTTFSYDYDNYIVRVDFPDQTYSEFKYDALGRRVEKRDREGNIIHYTYDSGNVTAEYDGTTLRASYLQSLDIDKPVSMYRDGQTYWFHPDALSSIYEISDSTEDIVRSYDYSAFGKIISENGTLENPFTYTGREKEESGLYYYRLRRMDPNLGRFLGPDPVGMPDGFNRYVYAKNSPMNWSDPTGAAVVRCVDYWFYDSLNIPLMGHAYICLRPRGQSVATNGPCYSFLAQNWWKAFTPFGSPGWIEQQTWLPTGQWDPKTHEETDTGNLCWLLCNVDEECMRRRIQKQIDHPELVPRYQVKHYNCHHWAWTQIIACREWW